MTQATAQAGTARCVEAGGLAPHPVLDRWYEASGHARFVRTLFDEGAGGYDRINRLFSLNTGGRYRSRLTMGYALRHVAGFLVALERQTAR